MEVRLESTTYNTAKAEKSRREKNTRVQDLEVATSGKEGLEES